MSLTHDQINLMRESFYRLQPVGDAASRRLYDRLFELEPNLRSLFPDDLTRLRMRFMSALAIMLYHGEAPDAVHPYLRRLALVHIAHGVQPEDFRPMGQALIDTMREMLGERFPEGADTAWKEAYAFMAREMMRSMRAQDAS